MTTWRSKLRQYGPIEWRDPPPGRGLVKQAQSRARIDWRVRLQPMLRWERRGRWACILKCQSRQTAVAVAEQLRNNRVRIPEPLAQWEFIAVGPEVFGRYIGPQRMRDGKPVEKPWTENFLDLYDDLM